MTKRLTDDTFAGSRTVPGIGPGGWDSGKLAESQESHAYPYKVTDPTSAALLDATYVLANYFIKRGDHDGLATVHAMRKRVGL